MRRWMITLATLAVAAPLAAQDPSNPRPADAAATSQAGTLPSGWEARLDRENASLANVRFVEHGDGYHVTLGPSGIFYDPAHRAEGEYTVRARFTQRSPSRHPEGYGVLIGGQDLDGPDQDYLYFLIRQDGRFLIKHRAGEETHTLQDWTEHPRITRAEGEGGATNTLAIEAAPQSARFLINGVEVANFEGIPYLNTAGVAGLRINHNLDVVVEDFGIEEAAP